MAKQGGDDGSMWIAIALAVAFVALVFFWEKNAPAVYRFLLGVASMEAAPFSLIPGSDAFQAALQRLDPDKLNIYQMNAVMNRAGRWYAWLLLIPLGYLVYRGYNASPKELFRRGLSMDKLLRNNVKLYPCLAPIVNWPGSILKENPDSGPWMTARQPIQFVAEKGLLEDVSTGEVIKAKDLLTDAHIANPNSPVIAGAIKAKFMRDKAEKEFARQFSKEYEGLQKLPPYMYALAVAFLLIGTGQKARGETILDNMSRSVKWPGKPKPAKWSLKPPFYTPGDKGRKNFAISSHTGVSAAEINKMLALEDVKLALRPHNRYRDHVILALYAFARQKGVICTSQFIWLRPVNRRLFYLLNNYGRRTAWIEVAGPLAHYQAEEALGNNSRKFQGRDIPPEDKLVEKAVNALELAIYEEGWTSDLQLDKKQYGLME